MEHTKGDWLTYCGEENWYIIIKDKPSRPDKVIAKIINDQNEVANAHLISASPDLYEALKGMMDYSGYGGLEVPRTNQDQRNRVIAAHKAIAKAEGSSLEGGG